MKCLKTNTLKLGRDYFFQNFETLLKYLINENKIYKIISLDFSKHSNTQTWQFLEKQKNHPTLVLTL